jgi:hypothetical protein
MHRNPRLAALLLAATAMLAAASPAGAEKAPVDLTGTAWHTEGRMVSRARGRASSGPVTVDLEFQAAGRFLAPDFGGLVLAGSWEPSNPRGTKARAECDAASLDAVEEELARELEVLLGDAFLVETLSHSIRARTNAALSRLRLRAALRFLVTDLDTGRSLRLRNSIRTRGER